MVHATTVLFSQFHGSLPAPSAPLLPPPLLPWPAGVMRLNFLLLALVQAKPQAKGPRNQKEYGEIRMGHLSL